MIRFRATWVESDGPQPEDQFDPDAVIYSHADFKAHKQAEDCAKKMAAKGPCSDWWEVEEQQYVPYLYQGVDIGGFETISTWVAGEHLPD